MLKSDAKIAIFFVFLSHYGQENQCYPGGVESRTVKSCSKSGRAGAYRGGSGVRENQGADQPENIRIVIVILKV